MDLLVENFFLDSLSNSNSESEIEIIHDKEDEIILMVALWIAVTGTKRKHAGLQVGRAAFFQNRIEGNEKLMHDYFHAPVVALSEDGEESVKNKYIRGTRLAAYIHVYYFE